MTIRAYQHTIDLEPVLRIYREVGWVPETAHRSAATEILESGRGVVAEVHGSPECLAIAHSGAIRYLTADLPMSAITSVITSRIARKQGFAGRLTAHLLAEEASRGFAVALLGMFEQGYYNRPCCLN